MAKNPNPKIYDDLSCCDSVFRAGYRYGVSARVHLQDGRCFDAYKRLSDDAGRVFRKIEGSIASLVRTLISNAENVKTAAIFILIAIIFAGLSALSALAGLFAGKSWRMVQFLLMAVCFVACLVAIILLFVAGGDLSSEFFNTSATVNAGAYLMVLFSLLGAGSCIALKNKNFRAVPSGGRLRFSRVEARLIKEFKNL